MTECRAWQGYGALLRERSWRAHAHAPGHDLVGELSLLACDPSRHPHQPMLESNPPIMNKAKRSTRSTNIAHPAFFPAHGAAEPAIQQ